MPNEHSQIGRKYVLWQKEYESPAYVDQMGVAREGYIVLREVEVTVVEERYISGQGSLLHDTRPYGLKAVTFEGEEFFNNWESDSASNGPLGSDWYTFIGKKYVFFTNAYEWYNKHGIGFVTPEGERAIPQGIMICEEHNCGFHPDDEGTSKGCHECYLDSIVPVEKPEAAVS